VLQVKFRNEKYFTCNILFCKPETVRIQQMDMNAQCHLRCLFLRNNRKK